jgi:GT2 family glycosyltransferase
MDLSVVIVSYNGRDDLRRCLRSLVDNTQGISYEIIVVDNASRDGSADMVASEFPQARLIARASNAGFGAAANEGIAVASGEAVLLLNPDAMVNGNALPPMLHYLRGNPDVAVLGPRLLDEDGSLQLSCRRFPGYGQALFGRHSLLTRLFPRNRLSTSYLMTDWDHAATTDIDWLSGACMMLPRHTLEELGLLDEGYFMYNEDVDLCQRAHRAGYRVVYFPEAAVVHRIGGSSSTLPARSIIERHRSMWHYYRKHLRGGRLKDAATATGIALRCGLLLALHTFKRGMERVFGRRRAEPNP